MMDFECDPIKAQANLRKHGVSFEEAASCLLDTMALVRDDPDSRLELRHVLLGMSQQGRLLTVVYTLRGDIPRIISARKASKSETKSYA